MNQITEQIIKLSSPLLRYRTQEEAGRRANEIVAKLPNLPASAVEFFSLISGGTMFGNNVSVPADRFSYLVDDVAPLASVNCELKTAGIGLEQHEGEDYFSNAFILFRSPVEFQFAWCISLNPGVSFGQIFLTHVFFGEHPGDAARVWAESFDGWLEMVLDDYLAYLSNPDMVRQRIAKRASFPTLEWS